MGDELPAGDFATWRTEMHAALRGERAANVPCDGCTACCTASQFVHVDPDEIDALAHIPRRLLFPAPGLPRGHMVMGYDEHGACPMFANGACSIYEHRPRACRTYDCRIFTATGIDPGDDGPAKQAVAERVRRWRFSYADEHDRADHDALRAAAATEAADEGRTPRSATERAVVALRDGRAT